MKPVIFNAFDQHPLLRSIAENLDFEIGDLILREFPDKETYVRLNTKLQDRELILLDSLDRPNQKTLPLLFIAKTAKELGAKRVGLCAPYLAYMRQDTRFNPGEGVTSDCFGALLSQYVDWLVTVDPHLHRYDSLNEIYAIPNAVLHAAPQISEWISKQVDNPLLIGPDEESEQWVGEVAKAANAPYIILNKIRRGDHDVEVSLPEVNTYRNYSPILIDDIISTGHTMIETIKHFKTNQMQACICIGVHGVFSQDAYEALLRAGAKDVITCNTIPHPSNQISLSNIVAEGIRQQLEG